MSEQQILDAVAKWIAQAFGDGVLPFTLSISTTRKILGDKSRSALYEAAGRGDLQFLKDGDKTLVVTDSVIGYLGRLPSAKIKASPSRIAKPAARASRKSLRSQGGHAIVSS
jgi:hypothetical protein